MAVFQIVDGRCHWRTPFETVEETIGRFPPDCLFVNAPDYVTEQWGFDETEVGDDRFIRPEVPEGWDFDPDSGNVMPIDMIEKSLKDAQARKQAENNKIFADRLKANPLTWTDGKEYGVGLNDQEEISLNLLSYQMAISAIDADESLTPEEKEAAKAKVVLEWHAVHEDCRPFTYDELVALSLAIREYIYPGYNLNQQYKTQIYACESQGAVEAIVLDYTSIWPDPEQPLPTFAANTAVEGNEIPMDEEEEVPAEETTE